VPAKTLFEYLTKNTQFWVEAMLEINNQIGDIDLFLLDYLLKAKIPDRGTVLDAGCGAGRQLLFFLQNGYDVQGLDHDSSEVRAANFLSRNLVGKDVCMSADIKALPFADDTFDILICSRVLHFSDSEDDFFRALSEFKRVMIHGGVLYLSMASMIGFSDHVVPLDNAKYEMPDGAVRFLLTPDMLTEIFKEWDEVEPYKTETTMLLTPH